MAGNFYMYGKGTLVLDLSPLDGAIREAHAALELSDEKRLIISRESLDSLLSEVSF